VRKLSIHTYACGIPPSLLHQRYPLTSYTNALTSVGVLEFGFDRTDPHGEQSLRGRRGCASALKPHLFNLDGFLTPMLELMYGTSTNKGHSANLTL